MTQRNTKVLQLIPHLIYKRCHHSYLTYIKKSFFRQRTEEIPFSAPDQFDDISLGIFKIESIRIKTRKVDFIHTAFFIQRPPIFHPSFHNRKLITRNIKGYMIKSRTIRLLKCYARFPDRYGKLIRSGICYIELHNILIKPFESLPLIRIK